VRPENIQKSIDNNYGCIIPAREAIVYATANRIRRRVLSHVIAHGSGYLSQALSSAEILSTLYLEIMSLGKIEKPIAPKPFCGTPSSGNGDYFTGAEYNGPVSPINDRFILSPAHYALALYALLVETKRMAPSGLDAFNTDGSSVEMIGAEHSPGMEVTSGSLGQALSQAAGIAFARRLKDEPGKVWVFMSDGEFQIGQTWEALEFISYHRLSNLAVYVDVNKQQCDGTMDSVLSIDPLDKRCESFGCRTVVVDGHDVAALAKPALEKPDSRPLVVLALTDPCKGVDLLQANAPKLHYLRFKNDAEKAQYRTFLAGWKD
jgi:transketolase